MKNKTLICLSIIGLLILSQPSLGIEGCDDLESTWEDTVEDNILHRTTTRIRGVIAQEEPSNMRYALELCANTETNSKMECNDRIVYVPADYPDLLYQIMDIAKLALAADAYVTVAVNRDDVKIVNGCYRPRVVSLSVLKPTRSNLGGMPQARHGGSAMEVRKSPEEAVWKAGGQVFKQ